MIKPTQTIRQGCFEFALPGDFQLRENFSTNPVYKKCSEDFLTKLTFSSKVSCFISPLSLKSEKVAHAQF